MDDSAEKERVTNAVRDFYEALPFNFDEDLDGAAARIRANPILAYPDLHAVLRCGGVRTVLDLGCGVGWASVALALHYGVTVTAVDITAAAIERGRHTAKILGTGSAVAFVCADLFDLMLPGQFDLVVGIGSLHHTWDCRMAFRRAASFAGPEGLVFVGLYHEYGRRPFLTRLRGILSSEGEEAAFRAFAKLCGDTRNPVHLRSWFRDQVLHPHESLHTLAEVLDWMDDDGLELLATSIGGYGPPGDRDRLFAEEIRLEALSKVRNARAGGYFPGFFTVLASRNRRMGGK